ncbi:MAG TPA: VOC family protein [Thermoleophilaceae bacterium]|nr:VOC family protein [Thermoleophilaceae bacterium]
MEANPHAGAGVSPRAALNPALRLGPVHLRVTDVDRSVAFYGDALGLPTHRREDRTAALGTGEEDVLVLVEEVAARPPGRHAGLFHFALLHPSREELARAVARLGASATPIEGASDHGVSEAIYLSDPDGNGIELYADRPRERWPAPAPGERVGMFTRPLDLRGLVGLVAGEEPPRHASEGLAVGHVHLHVGDIERGLAFYRDILGFEEMAVLPGAAFVSAGGYHHHLGFNVWRGSGVPPAPADAVGLRHWTIVLPDEADLAAMRERLVGAGVEAEDADRGLLVRDPWEIAVQVVVGA